MKMFPIADQVEVVLAQRADLDDPEILDLLEGLGLPSSELTLELAAYRTGELAEANAVLDVMEAMKERVFKHKRRAEQLETLIAHFHPEGSPRIGDARTEKIAWKLLPQKVEMFDGVDVPEEYRRVKPESWEPDKNLLLADLKAGAEIKGARLAERTSKLEIK